MVGKLHVVVDGLVDSLDTVGIVHSEFRVVRGLDRLVDDAVNNSQRVEIKLNTINTTVGNSLILLVKMIEELRSLVLPSLTHRPGRTHCRTIVPFRTKGNLSAQPSRPFKDSQEGTTYPP